MFWDETICFEGEREKERKKEIRKETREKKCGTKKGKKMRGSVGKNKNKLNLRKKKIGEGNFEKK